MEAELAESREAVNQMNTINSKVKTKAFMLEISKILAILVFKRIYRVILASDPVQYRNEKMLASQSDLLTQFLKSTTAATILGGPKPKNKIAECQNICSQI